MSSAPPAHQSKPSYQRRPPNSGPRQQQRYVPKSAAPSAPKPSPPPSLTTALRSSPAPSASGAGSSSGGGAADGFVFYLPHDEAIAAGLGGLDAQESQAVVDLLNDALASLLRAKPREFWRQVAQNASLHAFLDSYLQFRHRWYDLPHRGPKGTVAGLVVGELELCRRVFMVLYRISSNKDPGSGPGESLSMKEHTALLQEKRLLDLPKLLDICAIYGHDNGELTNSLVTNAIIVQPNLLDGINTVLPQFLDIFHTMQDRCMDSLQVWYETLSWLRIPCHPPDNESSLNAWWHSVRQLTPKPMRKGLASATLLVPWMLWKHRNDSVFNRGRPSINALLTKIKDEAALWASAGALGLRAITPQTWDVH